MLNSQRSLSELPKMSAASQVERAVLVSIVGEWTLKKRESQSSRHGLASWSTSRAFCGCMELWIDIKGYNRDVCHLDTSWWRRFCIPRGAGACHRPPAAHGVSWQRASRYRARERACEWQQSIRHAGTAGMSASRGQSNQIAIRSPLNATEHRTPERVYCRKQCTCNFEIA